MDRMGAGEMIWHRFRKVGGMLDGLFVRVVRYDETYPGFAALVYLDRFGPEPRIGTATHFPVAGIEFTDDEPSEEELALWIEMELSK